MLERKMDDREQFHVEGIPLKAFICRESVARQPYPPSSSLRDSTPPTKSSDGSSLVFARSKCATSIFTIAGVPDIVSLRRCCWSEKERERAAMMLDSVTAKERDGLFLHHFSFARPVAQKTKHSPLLFSCFSFFFFSFFVVVGIISPVERECVDVRECEEWICGCWIMHVKQVVRQRTSETYNDIDKLLTVFNYVGV